jgi:hypothetical protein
MEKKKKHLVVGFPASWGKSVCLCTKPLGKSWNVLIQVHSFLFD